MNEDLKRAIAAAVLVGLVFIVVQPLLNQYSGESQGFQGIAGTPFTSQKRGKS
jgi:hypothetical protein